MYYCGYCKKFRDFSVFKECRYCRSALAEEHKDSGDFYKQHMNEPDVTEKYVRLFEQSKEAKENLAKENELSIRRNQEIENTRQSYAKRIGEYEYDVITVINTKKGLTDTEAIKKILLEKSSAGWRLIAAYSNELGKNALSLYGFGVNATACQFERKIK